MSVTAIEKVVGRLRWRLRAQAALRHGLLLGAIGLFAFALLVVLVKARVLDTDWVWVGGAIAIGLPLLGVSLGVFRRLGDIELAAALDAAGGLHSRLGSALSFARLPARTPMQEAAIEDAATVLSQARPALAAPWRWGMFAAGAIALALAFGVTGPAVFALELPVAPTSAATLGRLVQPAPFERAKAELRKDDLERLEDLAKDLDEEVKTATDPAITQFLEDLNELIRALQEGRITPEEASARLAALEKALAEWKEQHGEGAEEVERRLQQAAEKIKKTHEALDPLLEALREQAWKEAAEALEKLADKLETRQLGEKDEKKIAKDLTELAKSLESERQKEKDRLQKERDRLKEKERKEKDRFANKDRDRLKDLERELERLDDPEQYGMSEAQRQLERLSEELGEAAQDLLRRLQELAQQGGAEGEQGPESEQRRDQPGQQGQQGNDGQGGDQGQGLTAEDLKRAAEALRKMGQGKAGRQQMRAAEGRVVDVREMMKRGQSGKGGKPGQAGEPGQPGQPGEQGEPGDAARQFEESAQGKGEGKDGQGAGEQGFKLSQGPGKGGDMALLGGPKGQGAKSPGIGQGDSDTQIGTEGIGQGHDKRLLGDKTGMEVDTKEDFVAGQHGDGDSKSNVVMTAAQKGFASRAYAEVHQDYAGVVEDALEKEHIPPGKRTYVRRYFDLIRPR